MSDKWISVEKELPETGRNVLVWHKDWYIDTSVRRSIKPWLPIGLSEDSATHWMPLPEPPSE